MKSLDQWLTAYGESHQNSTNQVIHKIMVPLIMFSILGLMWIIPVPKFLANISYLNWATMFGCLCLVFYALLSFKMLLGMILMIIPMFLLINYIAIEFSDIMLYLMIGIFIVAWIFQFIGHKIEGKKPSFLEDLLFLLIGPLWVLKSFYRVIGISKN